MDRVVTLVDDSDKALGHDTWTNCHFGKGRRHRGFVVLLQDDLGNVYLQKRKHKVFDGLWDLTAISHPYRVGKHEETLEEAATRALKVEMGIAKCDLENMGAFTYFSKDGKWCENEYCHILTGHFDGRIKPNLKYVYEAKKVRFEDFLRDVSKNPKKYTPWARLAAKQLAKKNSKTILLSSRRRGSGFPIRSGMTENESSEQFKRELEQFLKVFEPYLKRYFEIKIGAARAYSPLIWRFYRDLADFSAGGKRMRAFLVFLGYRIASSKFKVKSPKLEKVLPICLAVELAHSFLLIHDDIIDRSDVRRKKPTIHQQYAKDFGEHYGQSQAIILGDIASFSSQKLIFESDFDDHQKIQAVGELLEVLLETGYGEALDVYYVFKKPKLSAIVKMAELKTARYTFVGPLLVGASMGEITKRQREAIEKWGMNVGLAFQIQDDILGVFGDEETIGKSALSDMQEGKNTILIYKTREMVGDAQKARIARLWGNREGGAREIREMREIIRASGALEWCRQENVRLVGKAKKYIGEITHDHETSQIFAQMAEFVIFRQK